MLKALSLAAAGTALAACAPAAAPAPSAPAEKPAAKAEPTKAPEPVKAPAVKTYKIVHMAWNAVPSDPAVALPPGQKPQVAYQKVADEWMEAHPNVKIEWYRFPAGANFQEWLLARMTAQDAPEGHPRKAGVASRQLWRSRRVGTSRPADGTGPTAHRDTALPRGQTARKGKGSNSERN